MNKRIPHALFALGSALLLTTACTPAPKETKIAAPGASVSGTVELWHFFTEREAQAIDSVVKDFERASVGSFAVIPGSGQAQIQPILREDAARCIVEAVSKPELLGKIIELGGPEVVTYETMFDWFLQARGIRKPKLKLPVPTSAISTSSARSMNAT